MKKRKAIALAPPPKVKSRKLARKVTTRFHKLTRQRDEALHQGNDKEARRLEVEIEEMGGREAYQIASQVSTSYHSTSKWVLGYLARNGWIYGIKQEEVGGSRTGERRKQRRKTKVLEVGAINTELLDAADATVKDESGLSQEKYRIDVRSIDIHSIHPAIEEADFLKIPFIAKDPSDRYDVIVNSMVLNCVTQPENRGEMIARLFHFLRPGGLCFLTLPSTCLDLSPCIDRPRFDKYLTGAGFDIIEKKQSPKISFFICQRPEIVNIRQRYSDDLATTEPIRRGKKYRTDFSIALSLDSVLGHNISMT